MTGKSKVSWTPSGPVRYCACGYPVTPCDKKKHDYGHDCVRANELAAGIDGLEKRGYVALTEKEIEQELSRLNERYKRRMMKHRAPPIKIEDLRPTNYCHIRLLLAMGILVVVCAVLAILGLAA